jgi:hypothetical protein
MSKTAVITLASPGADTGPLFDLRSNVDSYAAIFESGVTKTSLLTGYTSTSVPDVATIIRVQSTGTCTSYVDLPISGLPATTTTTTTTTVFSSCTELGFAYDASDPIQACQLGFYGTYYLNPSTLAMWDGEFGTGGCYGLNAAVGYYSDHTNYYYYDGTELLLQGACVDLTTTVNVYLRRVSGTTTTNLSVGYSTRASSFPSPVWPSYTLAGTLDVTTTPTYCGSFVVPVGNDIAIGVKRTSSFSDISFKFGTSGSSYGTTVYCNWEPTTNVIVVESAYLTLDVYLNADVAGTSYSTCIGFAP